MRWSSSLLLLVGACTRGAPASGTQTPAITDSSDGKSAAPIAAYAGSDPSALDAAAAERVQDASIPLYEEETWPAPSYRSLAAFCKAWAGGRNGTCAQRPMPVAAPRVGLYVVHHLGGLSGSNLLADYEGHRESLRAVGDAE